MVFPPIPGLIYHTLQWEDFFFLTVLQQFLTSQVIKSAQNCTAATSTGQNLAVRTGDDNSNKTGSGEDKYIEMIIDKKGHDGAVHQFLLPIFHHIHTMEEKNGTTCDVKCGDMIIWTDGNISHDAFEDDSHACLYVIIQYNHICLI